MGRTTEKKIKKWRKEAMQDMSGFTEDERQGYMLSLISTIEETEIELKLEHIRADNLKVMLEVANERIKKLEQDWLKDMELNIRRDKTWGKITELMSKLEKGN